MDDYEKIERRAEKAEEQINSQLRDLWLDLMCEIEERDRQIEELRMRATVDQCRCNICSNTSVVEEGCVPNGWVRFWDGGPHGMSDKEVLLCEGCVAAVECCRREGVQYGKTS